MSDSPQPHVWKSGPILKSPTQRHSDPGDWDKVRGLIKRLYVAEDRTLKETIAIMAKDYGHKGTVKMYKYRIQKWGFDKNIKEADAWAVLRAKVKREAIGKESAFRVRGKSVSVDEVLRYFKRKGIVDPEKYMRLPDESWPTLECWTPVSPSSPCMTPTSDIEDVDEGTVSELASLSSLEDQAVSTASEPDMLHVQDKPLQCHTNSMSIILAYEHEVPRSPLPCQTLLVPERLFASIRDYYGGVFRSGIFRDDEKGFLRCSLSPLGAGMSDIFRGGVGNIPWNFFELCDSGVHLMKSGLLTEGRRHFSKASTLVKDMIEEQHPRTLDRVLQTLMLFYEAEFHEIATIFRKFFLDTARMFYNGHPLGEIFTQIGIFEDSQFTIIVARVRQCVSAMLADSWGTFHPTTLSCYMDLLRRERSSNSLHRLRNLMVQGEKIFGKDALRILRLKSVYGKTLCDQDRHSEAVEIFEDILSDSRRIGLANPHLNSLEDLAFCCYRLSRFNEAESTLIRAIQLTRQINGGPNNYFIVSMKTRLRTWLLEWGREDEAEKLKNEIDEWLGPDDIKVSAIGARIV